MPPKKFHVKKSKRRGESRARAVQAAVKEQRTEVCRGRPKKKQRGRRPQHAPTEPTRSGTPSDIEQRSNSPASSPAKEAPCDVVDFKESKPGPSEGAIASGSHECEPVVSVEQFEIPGSSASVKSICQEDFLPPAHSDICHAGSSLDIPNLGNQDCGSAAPGLQQEEEVIVEQADVGHIRVTRIDDDSDSDLSTINIGHIFEPSTPEVKVTIRKIASPNTVNEECPAAGTSAEMNPVENTIESKNPLLRPVETGQADSPQMKITQMEDLPTSAFESPVLDRSSFKGTSTPKAVSNVQEASTLTPKISDTDDTAGMSAPKVVDLSEEVAYPDRFSQDRCFEGAEEFDQALASEYINCMEKSSHDFDPEGIEGIREVCIGDRIFNLDVLCRPVTSDFQASSNTADADILDPADSIQAVSEQVKRRLPPGWKFHSSDERVKAELFVQNPRRSGVLRAVNVACDGTEVLVQVHMETLPKSNSIYTHELMKPPVPLSPQTVKPFTDVVVGAAYAVHFSKLCAGVDLPECVEQWHKHLECTLDSNKFEEPGYDRTLRTKDCAYLVSLKSKRCTSCSRYLEAVKKRQQRRPADGEVAPHTRHDILSPVRLLKKLDDKQRTIRSQAAKISRLQERMKMMIEKESVPVDDELSSELKKTMEDAPEFVKIFWEQQQKAHTVKRSSGMKWHPLLLRWALHIKSISPGAYSAMRDSGFIKLPSERTLYEYSHANPAKEGIQHHVIKRLGAVVQKSKSFFFTLYVLMFDEMYIFRNIVYNKGTGEIVGYANGDTVEEEIRQLEKELNEEAEKEDSAPVAKTMLTYLVRCLGSKDHGVVACFPTAVLTKELLHSRTWDVIEALELAGVRVLVLAADGHPVNIAFFNMHPPLTVLPSGVIFDTKNIFAWDRPLFFVTDLPHLLKTIRNCFSNSGAHKNTRMLTKNSEYITWKTIIACLKSEEQDVLKYCHKLTPQCVFLTSYSVMKVSLAARVMSKTVAVYIRDVLKMNRPETVKFILFVNDWFDCMNGKFRGQDVAEKNPNLAMYSDENDKRFDFLLSFLDYLDEWKAEVDALHLSPEEKLKRLLSNQTLTGIERTTRAFIAAVKYALGKRRTIEVEKKGTKEKVPIKEGYILGRTLQQDEAEHHFSRQRAMGGGNVHPSVSQFLHHETIMEAHGNLGFKRSRGNTEGVERKIDVDAPIAKRPKVSRRLDLSGNDPENVP